MARVRFGAGALAASVLTRGAILQDLRLHGWPLVLGSEELSAYEGPLRHFGAVIAPVANRIGGAAARINGRLCRFEANDGANTLHSGSAGTHLKIWEIEEVSDTHVTLGVDLPDGEGGFPGNRRVTATYRIDGPALALELSATTDAPTLMNIAHHPYWNLDGAPTWAGHRLTLAADRYLPTSGNLPVGAIAPVEGTSFDFRGGQVLEPHRTLRLDHNFCLGGATPALSLTGAGGLTLEVETTQTGMQVYDGARLHAVSAKGHGVARYGAFAGIAIEAQGWPDAPNRPRFPSIALAPGEDWRQVTRYRLRG